MVLGNKPKINNVEVNRWYAWLEFGLRPPQYTVQVFKPYIEIAFIKTVDLKSANYEGFIKRIISPFGLFIEKVI